MSHGFRIRRSWTRIAPELVQAFRPLPVANVSDSMARLSGFGAPLRPMHKGGILAGPALTVRSTSGDNLMLHKALDMAEPGDVIVIDAGASETNAIMGELMLTYASTRKIAGVVILGAIRDAEAIAAQDMPIYATAITHRGPYKAGPGEIGFAIAIGGSVIESGDLILGDYDGVVSVPRLEAPDILLAAQKKFAEEALQMEETKAGRLSRDWVDEALRAQGCVWVD